MNSIIKQIYNGDLCLSERGTTYIAEFRATRDIEVGGLLHPNIDTSSEELKQLEK